MSVVFEPFRHQALGFDQRISELTFYFLNLAMTASSSDSVLEIRALRASISEEQSRMKSDILGTPLNFDEANYRMRTVA